MEAIDPTATEAAPLRTGGWSTSPLTARGLEQLDRIAVGVFDLDLPSARADLHLIAKARSTFSELRDVGGKIIHVEDHAIPAAGLLLRRHSRT